MDNEIDRLSTASQEELTNNERAKFIHELIYDAANQAHFFKTRSPIPASSILKTLTLTQNADLVLGEPGPKIDWRSLTTNLHFMRGHLAKTTQGQRLLKFFHLLFHSRDKYYEASVKYEATRANLRLCEKIFIIDREQDRIYFEEDYGREEWRTVPDVGDGGVINRHSELRGMETVAARDGLDMTWATFQFYYYLDDNCINTEEMFNLHFADHQRIKKCYATFKAFQTKALTFENGGEYEALKRESSDLQTENNQAAMLLSRIKTSPQMWQCSKLLWDVLKQGERWLLHSAFSNTTRKVGTESIDDWYDTHGRALPHQVGCLRMEALLADTVREWLEGKSRNKVNDRSMSHQGSTSHHDRKRLRLNQQADSAKRGNNRSSAQEDGDPHGSGGYSTAHATGVLQDGNDGNTHSDLDASPNNSGYPGRKRKRSSEEDYDLQRIDSGYSSQQSPERRSTDDRQPSTSSSPGLAQESRRESDNHSTVREPDFCAGSHMAFKYEDPLELCTVCVAREWILLHWDRNAPQ